MLRPDKYPSKILVFGEYTTLLGGDSIAIPLFNYTGYWSHTIDDNKSLQLQKDFSDLVTFLESKYYQKKEILPLDFDFLFNELERNIFFKSDIPIGYGLGSSGALVAGLYDRFSIPTEIPEDWDKLLKQLSLIESFYHGKSSGFDPLVSYIQLPLAKISNNLSAPKLDLQYVTQYIYLFDSKQERRTTPLVEKFYSELSKDSFKKIVVNELIPLVNTTIQLLLKGEVKSLYKSWKIISKLQLQSFIEFIPENLTPLWEQSLKENNFSFKLCGAGGGGMFLVMINPILSQQDRLQIAQNLALIPINN